MSEVVVADAPGRVNLIGEHTDYHDGFVLPTILPQRTRATIERHTDSSVRARSDAIGAEWHSYELGREAAGRGWLDYVQGVTAILAQRGMAVPSFGVSIESTIPPGAAFRRALRSRSHCSVASVRCSTCRSMISAWR